MMMKCRENAPSRKTPAVNATTQRQSAATFLIYLVMTIPVILFTGQFVVVVSAIPRKTRLTWVNGIGYRYDHMEEEAPFISRFFGGKRVDFYHNPTAMSSDDDVAGYYRDLTQAGAQKLGRITEEVEGLSRHLRDAVAAVGKNGRVIHIAHSQGALVTSLAAKKLTTREMRQIEVLAFGGAASLRSTPATPFLRCVNYYALNDPLLFVVPTAEQALRSGLVSDDEFCFLAPRDGDPITDHHLLGPTYAQALQWEGRRFQHEYQSVAYRTVRFMVLLLKAIMIVLFNRCLILLKKVESTVMVPFYDNIVRPAIVMMMDLIKLSMMILQKERKRFSEDFLAIAIHRDMISRDLRHSDLALNTSC
jgi:hypothetical protein